MQALTHTPEFLRTLKNKKGTYRENKTNGNMKTVIRKQKQVDMDSKERKGNRNNKEFNDALNKKGIVLKVNKRSVWTLPTRGRKESHFASFPPDLVVPCIAAGSKKNGMVFDPFSGTGTTFVTSRKMDRNCIAIEKKKEYVDISNDRIYKELGVFN